MVMASLVLRGIRDLTIANNHVDVGVPNGRVLVVVALDWLDLEVKKYINGVIYNGSILVLSEDLYATQTLSMRSPSFTIV